MKQITTIGLDLAKQVFQVHGADAEGSPLIQPEVPPRRSAAVSSRSSTPVWSASRPAAGRITGRARSQHCGHDVRLIPPAYVKPFVKRGKTDAADAEAISEAVTRKTMRFVPIKSAEQQAAAMVLKTRLCFVSQRTQVINALARSLVGIGHHRRRRHGESCGIDRRSCATRRMLACRRLRASP